MATVVASVRQGISVALTTIPLRFHSANGSSSRPAIRRMTVKQTDLSDLNNDVLSAIIIILYRYLSSEMRFTLSFF